MPGLSLATADLALRWRPLPFALPPAPAVLLREDGGAFLLEDGFSDLLLEA